jgi:tryptophan halogenase
VPEGHDLRADGPPLDQLARGMEKVKADIQAAIAPMPGHRDYLERYCPMAEVA